MSRKPVTLTPESKIFTLLLTQLKPQYQYKLLSQSLKPIGVSMLVVFLFAVLVLVTSFLFPDFYPTSHKNILILYGSLGTQSAILCLASFYEQKSSDRHLLLTRLIVAWAMIFIMLWGTFILFLSIKEHRAVNYITWLLGNLLVVTLGIYKPRVLFMTATADIVLITIVFRQIQEPSSITTLLNCILFIFAYVLIGVVRYVSALKNILYVERVEQQQRELLQETICAENADMAKTSFLANMSHEIRTPINVVLGMNELIMRDSTEPKIRDYAANTQSAGRMLLEIISDILDFVKIESGKLEICTKEYELASLLNDLVVMTQVRTSGKKLEFITDIPSDIPHLLCGDELRLKQAVSNVLSNAVKYTLTGSVSFSVKWRSLTPPDVIELTFVIADTGIGMTPEGIEKIFDKFERLNLPENQTIEGSGLGMSITKSILDLMDGTISVESTHGVGSVFTIRVMQKVLNSSPIGALANYRALAQLQMQNLPSATFPNAHILVVDDNDMNLEVIRGLLKPYEAQVFCANSGQNALKLIEAAVKRDIRFDLIFMDHMMPEMNGLETVRAIRDMAEAERSDYFRIVPIVALTANVMRGAKEEYLSSGMQDFLAKPVLPKALDECLVRWLSHR